MTYKKINIADITEAPEEGLYVTKNAVLGSLLAAALAGFVAALRLKRGRK